ncbi:streptomycin 6-kinase [Yoonia maricola]|uniref:Streptomycin 6-kinase n=1 Tax=Yoonia maricola TaxID=420999 RepID=A0A2M8W2H0_9RHOB|nr:aminoglycoside phosphotransferase family protein [Yoonia maricola]PJI85123.1 streptomycin 6-kinase [Yoonia maricola]
MKLIIPPPKNTFDVLTRRWGLTNATLVRQSKRATVYKVDSPNGPAAFKLYSEIGYANERAAVAFSNGLQPGIGAGILKSDFRRAAILIEWLSGPTLSKTYHSGDYDTATRHACALVKKISDVPFRWAFAYRRLAPLLKQRLQSHRRANFNPDIERVLDHALSLLDGQFNNRQSERIIHGDLHYGNIIMTPNGPRAIDPKGIRVHPLFECRNLFAEPKSETDLKGFESRIQHQIAIITEELGYDRQIILQFNILNMIPSLMKPGLTPETIDQRIQRIDLLMQAEAAL